jgi:ABC-2 type transport system permease protein
MFAIIRWSLWQRRWNIFWWSLGIILLIAFTLVFYPSFKDQAAELQKTLGNLPQGALELFGGTDFFSPVGYLNSQIIYFTLPLILAVLGIGLGSNLIGREERDLTIEALLSRPISRTRLLLAKALVGILTLFTVTLLASLVAIVMIKPIGMAVPLDNVAQACFACFMLVLAISSVSFLLTATGRGRNAAIGLAGVYALAGYIIGSLAGTVHWLNTPSKIFPYHYYHTADILRGSFRWSDILFFVILTVGCGLLSWLSFRRRDIS